MRFLTSLLLTICISSLLAQPLTFTECNSPECNQAKYHELMQAVEKGLYEYYGFSYNDSLSLTLKISGDQLILDDAYAWVNPEAPEIYFEVLEKKFAAGNVSAQSTFTINWLQNADNDFEKFPGIDCNIRVPTPKTCTNYNNAGQQGCWRYMFSRMSDQFWDKQRFKDYFGAYLFYEKGQIKKVTFYDPPLNQKLAIKYIKALKEMEANYYPAAEFEKADNFHYKVERKPYLGMDSTERKQALTRHLDFYLDNNLRTQFNFLMQIKDWDGKIDTSRNSENLLVYNYLEEAYAANQLTRKWWTAVDAKPLFEREQVNFSLTEKPPIFQGCPANGSAEELKSCFQQQILRHVGSTFVFPDQARQQGIQGRSYTSFVVEKSGQVCNIKVVKSSHILLDMEAIRVISEMPSCQKPAIINGEPVRMSFTLPINAKLEGGESLWESFLNLFKR